MNASLPPIVRSESPSTPARPELGDRVEVADGAGRCPEPRAPQIGLSAPGRERRDTFRMTANATSATGSGLRPRPGLHGSCGMPAQSAVSRRSTYSRSWTWLALYVRQQGCAYVFRLRVIVSIRDRTSCWCLQVP